MTTSEGRQIAIRDLFGLIPVVMVREAVPYGDSPGAWIWGRWRFARVAEKVRFNAALKSLWRE